MGVGYYKQSVSVRFFYKDTDVRPGAVCWASQKVALHREV